MSAIIIVVVAIHCAAFLYPIGLVVSEAVKQWRGS